MCEGVRSREKPTGPNLGATAKELVRIGKVMEAGRAKRFAIRLHDVNSCSDIHGAGRERCRIQGESLVVVAVPAGSGVLLFAEAAAAAANALFSDGACLTCLRLLRTLGARASTPWSAKERATSTPRRDAESTFRNTIAQDGKTRLSAHRKAPRRERWRTHGGRLNARQ